MKFLTVLFVAMSFIFSTQVLSQVINSEFKPTHEMSQVKEGDLVEITLKFWPIENADLSQFRKLEKSTFFNAFYLAQVLSLELSSNNADVVELRGLFVVKSAKPQTFYVIKYNETPIEMRIEGLKIEELKDKGQNYIILDQSVNSSYLIVVVAVIFGLIFIGAIIKRKRLKTFFLGLKPDSRKTAKKRYDELFRSASKREDFELIYKEKDQWLKLLVTQAPAHNEFFKVINQYQFKKDWSNEDNTIVLSAFDTIRRSFEK